ncbi:molybdopterin-synthase adenylyltransferase MoeB [Cyclobacterium marinum]|uniref:Molybdopterin-synthase adenylyltransferase n=1 Tax=Cyclobacterium marinum (strain ATCC 25205 / DSM 745 / LMG 13164 / NCIMB 1802) TaxID=880070 RepID=G0J0Y0_CYCMS|nr:molybdopterin-synthase adenylyltransferase MoeB [Cyclobacterium marinum]AEL25106.1 UBA/THIF-type NAD/FAD binding protein [Cyclobacterium marinum DSM 745]MBI0401423.1 molybdopterin-synthase adenylyltransferase MoeB [Cyclobacterium marinum]
MATVFIPTPLRKFTGNISKIELEAQSIGELLDSLSIKHPELKKYLYTPEGKIPSFINIFVDDEDIRDLEMEKTSISSTSLISIVPAIAGGIDDIFSKEELARYNRHIIIPEFGREAQVKLKKAKVLVVGSGGLGSPLLLYLAAAGVGTIGLIDFDLVEDSNLQRQVLFGVNEIGTAKVVAAKNRLEAINPYITIETYNQKLTSENALELISKYDVIADGTDNFPTRYLVNDACVLTGKTNVYASIFQFEGQVSVFNYLKDGERGPNYRDLYETPPPAGLVPSCAEGGVLGVLPGIIGSLQALEVIKVVTGIGDNLSGKLYTFDAFSFQSKTFKIKRKESNPLNGTQPTQTTLIDYEQFCNVKSEEKAIKEIAADEFHALKEGEEAYQLIDVREQHEFDLVNINGFHIPLQNITENVDKIKKDRKVVVHCKMGGRSAKAIRELEAKFGFDNLFNLTGGIDAYLEKYDSSVTQN